MRGLFAPLLGPLSGGASEAIVFDFYVDSVNGSDSNDGMSSSTALQTIGALTLSNGVYIGLARDSEWLERLDGPTLTDVYVGAYGSGMMPVLDARAVVSSWTASGTTNVYFTTWTPVFGEKVAPSIWEDDIRLQRVADEATCGTTPGSYYASNVYAIGVPANLYVHPTGSGDPAANGKVYKQAVRRNCIHLGDNATVNDVRGIGNQHDDGVFTLGRFARANRLVAQDGTKHNIFLGSGYAADCVAYKWDRWFSIFGATSTNPYIAYNTANAVDPLIWSRCIAIFGDDDFSNGGGFYAHSQSGQTAFGSIQVVDCEGYNLDGFSVGASECLTLTIDGATAYNCGRLIANTVSSANIPGGVTIRNFEWLLDRNPSEITFRGVYRPQSAFDADITLEDGLIVFTGTSGSFSNNPINIAFSGASGAVSLTRVAFLADPLVGGPNGGNVQGISLQNAGSDIDMVISHCLWQGYAGYTGTGSRAYAINAVAGAFSSFASENNLFSAMNGATERGAVNYEGVTYNTATAYLAAVQPALEAGSASTALAQVTGITTRDYDFSGDLVQSMGNVPQLTIKGQGQTLADRLTALVAWLEATPPEPIFGPELTTNGGFTTDTGWTKSSGYTISGDQLHCAGTVAQFALCYQTAVGSTLAGGRTYRVIVDLAAISGAASLQVFIGHTSATANRAFNLTGAGTFSIDITIGTVSNQNIVFRKTGTTLAADVNSISVREITGYTVPASGPWPIYRA